MSTQVINPKLLDKLKDKKYRDLFVASQINKLIPFQIRALRAARGMTQEELAEGAETTQSVISRIQNRGAANLNVKSLLKLASAFDVALTVRFEPIDRFIDWVDDLSPEVMSPKPSDALLEEIEREAASEDAAQNNAAEVTEWLKGFTLHEPVTITSVQVQAPNFAPKFVATSPIQLLPFMYPLAAPAISVSKGTTQRRVAAEGRTPQAALRFSPKKEVA